MFGLIQLHFAPSQIHQTPPWKTYSKVHQLTLLHQMCFPCMQLSAHRSNCIPEPNTHPSVIWHCLFDAPCVCVHINVCLRCLEHITAGKPNLPAIVLIKAVFLRLSLDGRQDQLHKTTGTQTGRLPQPHWHPLWTSPDFKRYSLSDYRVTDWVKKKKKEREKCILQITYIQTLTFCCLWNMSCSLKTDRYRTTKWAHFESQ